MLYYLLKQGTVNIAALKSLVLLSLAMDVSCLLHPFLKKLYFGAVFKVSKCEGQLDLVVMQDVREDEKVSITFVER